MTGAEKLHMDKKLLQHIENLKDALMSLPPSGDKGFEGLIGVALGIISGVPFRLAGSGSQFGIDGKPTYESDAICFEAKRYQDEIPKDKIISKISEFLLNDTQTDIWVLCTTSNVKSQIADDARALGIRSGIDVFILDWSVTDLPSLAVALAMGGKCVQEFLKIYITDKGLLQKALACLEAIPNCQNFDSHADRIRIHCSQPTIGLALAQKANAEWLNDGFSNRKQAILKFGQPLSPGDVNTSKVRPRKLLTDKLQPFLTTSIDNEKLVCIHGGEGNGKSWIVGQCWLALDKKPLMIFISPDNFAETAIQNNFIDLLITNLIKQTGDKDNPTIRERWQKRLERWKRYPVKDLLRLIIVIDGINQRPNSDWARIADSIINELKTFGGRLVITSRTHYFQEYVKRRFSSECIEISVPEWEISERNEILATYGIKVADLHPAVANSLCNPRLLGIALEILGRNEICNFEELNVTRLLFEHIRMNERDALVPHPEQEFMRRLQTHAQEIISRAKAKQQDDINVFEKDIAAVADGRFYQFVEGDPTRYCLKDDGLTLALGFAVIDRLRTSKRNRRDPRADVEAILEPISALDDTSNVVVAALTVIVIGEHYDQDIAVALVKGFSKLQNPDQSMYNAFAGLAKSKPQCFTKAAHDLSLEGGYQPNYDWIREALIEASYDKNAWDEIAKILHDWLSACHLSPEQSVAHSKHISEAENQRRIEKINENIRLLSEGEKSFFNNLVKEPGDINKLSRLAFSLLAGKLLASFASSLVNWSFYNALYSDYTTPYKDFIHLISLNTIDWLKTRMALLKASDVFRKDNTSRTGKWALVNILRATGHSDDCIEAQHLVNDLTIDRPSYIGGRLIDNYCASDPCDPSSEEPDNITRTSEQYAMIDVTKLRQSRSQTSEGYFFNEARTGIARFKPEVAINKHRQFAVDVINRSGFSLLQGMLELRQHVALLTETEARKLLKKLHDTKTVGNVFDLSKQDAWLVSQYHLLLAFPFLNVQEQTKILLSKEANEDILVDLMELVKPLSEKEFESLIGTACSENNEQNQYLLLELAATTSVQLSTDSRIKVAALFRSESKRVRQAALSVIAQNDDTELLKQITESEWKATDVDADSDMNWYGSLALLNAAKIGLISHQEVIKLISVRLYGWAATILDVDAVCVIAQRIDASIRHAAGQVGDYIVPTPPKGHIILDHLSLEEFACVVSAAKAMADQWYKLFMSIADSKLPLFHNLILLLAHALGAEAPDKAENLFRRVNGSDPWTIFTCDGSGIQLDMLAIWSGECNTVLDILRFDRLDGAENDHSLFLEVLAALKMGKQKLLAKYIEAKLRKKEPAEVSRGIMVAGFLDQNDISEEILKKYEDDAGLISNARKAAQYAYERNIWAKYWYEKMCQTNDDTDFWRYSLLFSKIVDGRFEVWNSNYIMSGSSIQQFWISVKSNSKKRFEQWKNHRQKKLFGLDAPASIFLLKNIRKS